jgi:3'-phosphoadenosine 5'-phosphosulfate sulfotransferase (PAPS reductase)/FAD synthetase
MKVLVFFSGGKDSQACLIWAVKEYGLNNCEAVFCDTGWENPVTYEHIVTVCNQIGVKLVAIKSKKYDGFVDMAVKRHRFPSTKVRFCTEELKSIPINDYVLDQKENLIIIQGIRANESQSRGRMQEACTYWKYHFEKKDNGKRDSYRKKDVVEWCKTYNADIIRPIFNWTAQETINFITENGQQPNPLYYMGFTRVGCFPCIMNRHAGIKLIIDNHPEQWEKVKEAERLVVGGNFFPPDYIPKRFCKNKSYPQAEDVERYINAKNNTIDMFDQETPSCMSAYNLCE